MKRTIFFLTVLFSSALLLSSCGGGGGGTDDPPEDIIPGVPGSPSHTAESNNVTVTWSAGENAKGYELLMEGATQSTANLSHTYTGLDYEKNYVCQIRSVRDGKYSSWANAEFKLSYPTGDWLGKWSTGNVSAAVSAGTFELPLDFIMPGEGGLSLDIVFKENLTTPGKLNINIAGLEESSLPLPEGVFDNVPLSVSQSGASASVKIDQTVAQTLPEPLVIGEIPGFSLISDAIVESAGLLGSIVSQAMASAQLYGVELTVKTFDISAKMKTGSNASADLILTGKGKVRLVSSLDDVDIPLFGNLGDIMNNLIGDLMIKLSTEIAKAGS